MKRDAQSFAMKKKINKNNSLDACSSQKHTPPEKKHTYDDFSSEQACKDGSGRPVPERDDGISCDFCARWCDTVTKEDTAGSMPAYFMTEREHMILAEMRRIKEAARSLKNRMGEIEKYLVDNMVEMDGPGKEPKGEEKDLRIRHMAEDWMLMAQRLDALRKLWKNKDRERLEAAEERMRLLGHIQ